MEPVYWNTNWWGNNVKRLYFPPISALTTFCGHPLAIPEEDLWQFPLPWDYILSTGASHSVETPTLLPMKCHFILPPQNNVGQVTWLLEVEGQVKSDQETPPLSSSRSCFSHVLSMGSWRTLWGLLLLRVQVGQFCLRVDSCAPLPGLHCHQ